MIVFNVQKDSSYIILCAFLLTLRSFSCFCLDRFKILKTSFRNLSVVSFEAIFWPHLETVSNAFVTVGQAINILNSKEPNYKDHFLSYSNSQSLAFFFILFFEEIGEFFIFSKLFPLNVEN